MLLKGLCCYGHLCSPLNLQIVVSRSFRKLVLGSRCLFACLQSSGCGVVTSLSSTVDGKANSADIYTASAVDTLLSVKLVAADISGKADSSYLQEVLDGVNEALGNRAQVNAVYSITAMDTLLGDKADASALASKLEAADIAGKLDASVHDARVTAENAFFLAMSESLYVESAPASGTEFSYAGLIGV